MRLWLAFIWISWLVTILSGSWGLSQETGRSKTLKITSPVFENGKNIPIKYGCDGDNVNPAVRFEDVPPEAKSLALILDDQDAPRGTYVHWVLWNIDPATKEIKEDSVPAGAVQGLNDFKKNFYGGPCPPTRPHNYVFKVYALDTRLELNSKSSKMDLERAMDGHIIGKGQLMGIYKREKKKQ